MTSVMKPIFIEHVDYYSQPSLHRLIALLNGYAKDPMGGGNALPQSVHSRLIEVLPKQPNVFSLMVLVDGKDAGFCNCVWGFSTFAAAPLVNIHDLFVLPEYRGLGLSQTLLDGVAEVAKQAGAVKITLEVLENNTVAQGAYRRYGFVPYELSDSGGKAELWQCHLP